MVGQRATQVLWIAEGGVRPLPPALGAALVSAELSILPLASVQAAVAHFEAANQAIDGILLDLNQAATLAALQWLQTQAPQVPIIAVVPQQQLPLGLGAIAAGAADVLYRETLSGTEILRAIACAQTRYQHQERRRATASDQAATPAAIAYPETTAQLIQQEQRYRSIFEGVPVSLWEEDWSAIMAMVRDLQRQGGTDMAAYIDEHPDFVIQAIEAVKILDINTATLTIFKAQTKQDIIQSLGSIFSTPDTLPGFKQELTAFCLGESGFETEMALRTLTGELIYGLVTMTFPDWTSGSSLVLVSVLDITQQRQAKQELTRNQSLLRMASHVSRLGAWWVNLATMTMTWSEEMYGILEHPLDHMPSLDDVPQYYVADDRRQIITAFNRCAQTGEGFDLQLRVITAKGHLLWTRSIGEAVRNESGQIVRVQGAFQDISVQKAAAQQLQDSEERFRLLSKATNDAIWDWNIVNDLTWRGGAYKTLFGYGDGEALTANDWWRDRLHPEDRQRVLASIQTTLDRGDSTWFQEYRFRCQDGHYAYVCDRGYVIRNSQGQPVRMIGGMLNLTEKKNLEAQLLQSQKMEAIGQLAGGIAHDFNNLLSVILGYSEMVLSHLPSSSSIRNWAVDIHTAGERASALTQQLLAFSRKQVLTPQVIDLNTVVMNLEQLLKRLINQNICLRTVLRPDIPAVKVDPIQLEQVMLNLVVNARDAMPQGGDLTLETSMATLDGYIALEQLNCQPGTYAVLTITDTGSGMTPEVQAHIFEPFFTTKPPGKGTGLGLATVFGIVKQSGGLIEVYSEVDVGTRFKVLFPQAVTAINGATQD
ncbi:hybrid sensor histidine kinase/response regulator [Nodosilinea sp. P-1105]|uniref:PAS domain-containing sensor histidine kinase n=1 Tax=Nodosilinea sp. P-1105 TaxID=2546229 RepID=UPI00146DF5BF|nr:hybrid sensor histidine kinase/response regulator [Nodosilinea sp. P-1105]NMF84992.1 PAS domain S-box protein [Nodosilinea sp. P-1105]